MKTRGGMNQMNQKNFKKKSSHSIENSKDKNMQSSDRFLELRSKLQKEKEMMRKTGKRFKDQNSTSIQIDSLPSKKVDQKYNQPNQISIGTDDMVTQLPAKSQKNIVNLNQMSLKSNLENQNSLAASRVFEKQIKNQKKRESDLLEFLRKIQLEKFFDGLVDAGFDDLDSLSGVTVQDLNHLMMRGKQQDKLFLCLKQCDILCDNQQQKSQQVRPNTESIRFRNKTQKSIQNSNIKQFSRMKTQSSSEVGSSSKKSDNENKCKSFMGNSFIYMVGSKNWSLEDQVRKACSNCFRIAPQMQKKGDCYYCDSCFKIVSDDLLKINLQAKMSRSYYKGSEL